MKLKDGEYEILSEGNEKVFGCPNCGEHTFEIMEGELNQKAVLGLACLSCDTYGAVFPNGL